MDNNPSTSKEKLPTKIVPDLKKGKWYSRISPQKKSTAKSQKDGNRTLKTSKEKQNDFINPDEYSSPKKRRYESISSDKVFKTRKYLSPSAKLESKIPKVADLLKEREEAQKLKEIDKLVKKSSTQFLKELKSNKNLIIQEKPKIINIKDCKHLTQKQLERKFRKDIKYIDGIFNGTIYSERHELFQKQLDVVGCSLKEDLRVTGESLGVFTSDQLVYIVSLFREKYDNGNKYKYSDYYFKVLLPEYCLKIFMDCHGMEKEKAMKYLANVPIPDLFGLMM